MSSKRFKGGLFWKIFAISVLCMLIPMLISLFTSVHLSKKYLTDSSSNRLLNISAEKRNQFELSLFDIEKQGLSIAMQPNVVDTLSKAKSNSTAPNEAELEIVTKNLEGNFELANGLFENIYLMYNNKVITDGIGGASVGWENETVGTTESILIRPAVGSPTTGRPTMAIIAPIKDNGKQLGVIGMAIELNALSEKIIDNNAADQNLKTLIVTSSGLVISSTDSELVLNLNFQEEDSGLQGFFNKIASEKTGIGHFTLDGVEYISAFSDSDKYGMYVLSYMPVTAYMKTIVTLEIILFAVILFSILIASVVIYITIKRIVRPILATAKQAEQLADWNLAMTIPQEHLNRKDELGKLASSFATMITNLKSMMGQIIDASGHVAASSQELYASGDQVGKAAEDVAGMIMGIASGAEEQSSQIDSALLNLNSLVKQINEVNESTVIMENTTTHIMDDINRGGKSVAESIDKINDLKNDTEGVSKVITDLGNTSNQIGEIVELISGVAGQTNMLALNAAIEAARAGEAGRGFSVVADEIRKLAEETSNASSRIAKLIVEIKNGVDTAINRMDNSILSLNSSVAAIKENEDVFSVINEQAGVLNKIVAGVTQNVKIMTESSHDFECTMQDIHQASQVFAANSESVSASSEEQIALTEEIVSSSKAMASMSEELSSLIRNFKI
jgi:methyl-accepting chemotaxis protein